MYWLKSPQAVPPCSQHLWKTLLQVITTIGSNTFYLTNISACSATGASKFSNNSIAYINNHLKLIKFEEKSQFLTKVIDCSVYKKHNVIMLHMGQSAA